MTKKNIQETTMISMIRVVTRKKRRVKKTTTRKRKMTQPRPAYYVVPGIYANNKRVLSLLGQVTSVQCVRGSSTVSYVLMERCKR